MKKLSRVLVCAAMLALMLCTSAMAAGSEISIQLNGEPLTFTDAAPQIVSDRTYLPFRAVFTALGFADEDITYQAETKTVCAASDALTISMVIGENKVTVVKDGQTTVIDTDVPAFIDAQLGRTYVPARFVSEAAGYRVGWNGDSRTVIIDDVAAILAGNKETYDILGQYLDYARQFQQKNYQVDGSYSAVMEMEDGKMDMKGGYSMLMAGSSTFDFTTNMQFSGVVDGEDMAAALPNGVDFELRGSLDSGAFYFKSDALMSLMETGIENMWFKLDLAQLMDAMAQETGMSYSDLIALNQNSLKDLDGKAYIEMMVEMMGEMDATTSAQTYLTMFNNLLGDSAFQKQGSSYVSKFSMDGAEVSMTLTTASNKINGYSVVLSAKEEGVEMSMDISMKDNQMSAKMKAVMDGVSMQFDMDGKYVSTTKAPAGTPDQNAAVMDLMQMVQPLQPAA